VAHMPTRTRVITDLRISITSSRLNIVVHQVAVILSL
jgi:hypothetical protein